MIEDREKEMKYQMDFTGSQKMNFSIPVYQLHWFASASLLQLYRDCLKG